MADKQATVYIVDQGASMAECHSGRVESDLDFAMKYVWDKICTTMAANRTTWSVGVLGLRTEDSENALYNSEDDDAYEHITVHKELGPATVDDLTQLQTKLKTGETEAGDALSAVIIAIDMITRFTTLKTGKPGKYTRKIVLVTDGLGAIDDGGDSEHVISTYKQLNECDIELVVLGVDFDDLEFGFKEEDKPEHKRNNETLLQDLTNGCNKGIFGTVAEAVDNLSIPELKATRPYVNYRGQLGLGDFKTYPNTALYIDVQRYFYTHAAKPVGAKIFVVSTSDENTAQSSHTVVGDTEMQDAGNLSAVRSSIRYQVNDASSAGGKRDVERDILERGYEYGRTAVSISQSDENVTKLETMPDFSIIGFIPNNSYERYLNMGESRITVAMPNNQKAVVALSSLVRALAELDSYAVARIVTKEGKDPELILLAPLLEPHLHALVDVPLPFAEDIRMYRFPPLDRVITASGATVTKHRNLPTEDLSDAMSDYVDAMDLSTFGRDDEGQPAEYMKAEDTYSPAIHRINKAVRDRASNPTGEVAPPADVLMQWSKPPAELVSKTTAELKKLMEAAKIKKVPAKVKGRKSNSEKKAPMSGLDVELLLNRETPREITKQDAIPAFKERINTTDSEEDIVTAIQEMSAVICDLVKNSTGDSGYARALENTRIVREEMVDLDHAKEYNDFIRDLKQKVLGRELGEGRNRFFWEIKTARLGLIDNTALENSDVTEEDAKQFYRIAKREIPVRSREDDWSF